MAGDTELGEKYYKKSIAEKKSTAFAYWQLAGLELSRGNTKQVIDYCKKSLAITPNYMCFRHAAIALTVSGSYDKARNMYISAYETNTSLFSDSDLVGAAMYSYVELNEIDMAKGLFELGRKNNKNAKNSSLFVQGVKHLKSRLPKK